jgi:acyl-CoA thioesterase
VPDKPLSPAQIRRMLRDMPFNTLLGIRVSEIHPDGITIECVIRPEMWNSMGVVHGGITATLADAAVGIALMQRSGAEQPATTVELKVNYLRPAGTGKLRARSHLLRSGSTLAVGRADITDEKANLVATALVTYLYLDRRA